MTAPIEDYALIGNCRTAALVCKNGSIDWLCLPRFDSAACFASLLGGPEHGHWQIAPKGTVTRVSRRYRPETLVLETEMETEGGIVRLTDFMPIGDDPTVVRIVNGLRGRVDMTLELAVRFDYGQLVPWVTRSDGDLVVIAGPDLLVLRTPVAHHGEDFKTVAEFRVAEGEEVPFVLTYGAAHRPAPGPIDYRKSVKETEAAWTDWTGQCTFAGPWRDAVIRSLITLKALTYAPTGGMVAAPTTSLPERFGGNRNWDYRFCWLRDATFVLLSLMQAGYRAEAETWRAWLVRAVAALPSQLQPIYSVMGERRLDERELPWLPGYGGAKPVRIGNAAYSQLQIDVFGEVLDALHHARRHHLGPDKASWALQKAVLQHLGTMLDAVDCGIWEIRGPERHFTHSKLMIWVAFDRAVAAVEEHGRDGPVDHWRRVRDAMRDEILQRGYNAEIGAFVQAYGSRDLDASTLLIPIVGFLPATDPRMVGTVEAIERNLMRDGFVHRYDTQQTDDGLPPGEGVFLACTYWFADNLVLQGRRDEAVQIFERLLDIRNDVGLLAEEFDVESGRFLGNFPQALSHLALIDTAYNLQEERGPAHERSEHGESDRRD